MTGCLTAVHVAGVANTLADGISRWDSPSISAILRRFRPDVCWREQVLGHAGADLLFGHLGREYIDLSVTTSFRRAYESGFRSFTFRSLTGAPRYLQVEESESERIQGLIAFCGVVLLVGT